jgi:glyoxylase-like metal-dependent hydrolase (beta-lactamase superfamily II)
MKQLARGVWRLGEFPRPTINVYLAEDVLIDAGRTWDRRRIFKQTADRDVTMVALTHAHPDHQGIAKDFCEERRVPLACHVDDVDGMEGRRPLQEAAPGHPLNRLIRRIWEGPPYRVERPFSEGDEIAGFRVVHAPGHARGAVIFFRDEDGVAICGDVLRNMSYATTLPGLREPPVIFTYDPAVNRESIRKLAALEPKLVLPGHGPAVSDMDELQRFAAGLP